MQTALKHIIFSQRNDLAFILRRENFLSVGNKRRNQAQKNECPRFTWPGISAISQ